MLPLFPSACQIKRVVGRACNTNAASGGWAPTCALLSHPPPERRGAGLPCTGGEVRRLHGGAHSKWVRGGGGRTQLPVRQARIPQM